MKRIILIIVFVLICFRGFAQEIQRFNPDTIKTIELDSVVNITAQKFGVETFINAIVTDNSFYEAFRNMKKYDFIAENSIYTYNKQNKVEGRIYRKIRHTPGQKNKMEYLTKLDTGKVYKKNGKYQLYTVEMFDYIFMNAYKSEFSADERGMLSDKPESGHESYKDKLKILIFAPGRPIKGLPFIGNKTQIFTPEMRKLYDYSYYSGTYLDSIPVYWFKVKVKEELSNSKKDDLMIKELTTIFDKRTFEILGRYVDMKYSNMLFNFDVQMNIEMSYFGSEKLPAKITYQGNWDYPFKKQERASFLIVHKNYQAARAK